MLGVVLFGREGMTSGQVSKKGPTPFLLFAKAKAERARVSAAA
jgi:hypothetical protein